MVIARSESSAYKTVTHFPDYFVNQDVERRPGLYSKSSSPWSSKICKVRKGKPRDDLQLTLVVPHVVLLSPRTKEYPREFTQNIFFLTRISALTSNKRRLRKTPFILAEIVHPSVTATAK